MRRRSPSDERLDGSPLLRRGSVRQVPLEGHRLARRAAEIGAIDLPLPATAEQRVHHTLAPGPLGGERVARLQLLVHVDSRYRRPSVTSSPLPRRDASSSQTGRQSRTGSTPSVRSMVSRSGATRRKPRSSLKELAYPSVESMISAGAMQSSSSTWKPTRN